MTGHDGGRGAAPVVIQPPGWPRPKGYSSGILMQGTRLLFIAGQVAWDAQGHIIGPAFPDQFRQALLNVLAVLNTAGGSPTDIGRLTIYVTDAADYAAHAREVGAVYRALMGQHYPAMTLVQVAALLEEGATVELEATAVLPTE